MLHIAVCGKPNVGKSSFFNSATASTVEMANYPFTTIDANAAIAYVTAECPCKELELTCNPRTGKCEEGIRYIPVELIDVAGLVPGAYEGKGLGNKFLDATALTIAIIGAVNWGLIGIFRKKRLSKWIWISIALAVCGLYFLCCMGVEKFLLSDGLTLICALLFAVQITYIDKYAQMGDPKAFTFAKPHIKGFDYSFSGLKTSFLYTLRDAQKEDPNFVQNHLYDLCASLQKTVVDILMDKVHKAMKETGVKHLAVAGGVSANSGVRNAVAEYCERRGIKAFIPKRSFTTDNAAMIAIAGYFKYLEKDFCDINLPPFARVTV